MDTEFPVKYNTMAGVAAHDDNELASPASQPVRINASQFLMKLMIIIVASNLNGLQATSTEQSLDESFITISDILSISTSSTEYVYMQFVRYSHIINNWYLKATSGFLYIKLFLI